MAKDHEFTKLFTKTPEFQEVYETKLASSLVASKMIGNLYTASLYLGFRSSLEFEYQKGINLDGKRIGFGSYGSGASAMVFSVQPDYEEVVKTMNLEAELGPRRKLTLDEYERMHESKLDPEDSMLNPKHEFILVDVNKTTESRGERRYVFNE
jgi:hydroxymethylglutaryl-CoA synthase